MPQARANVISAIARARADLDRALARLESLADDDRQRVSYSVHALNNYLMVVGTTLQLLRSKLALRGDRDVMRWLDSLKQATNLMMSTARGVLTATSDALPPLLFEQASLTEVAAGVCQSYATVARKKRVRITWRAPHELDSVYTDRVAAGAVLDNVLSNAVKYSTPGTTVSVTMIKNLDEVVCSIRDHGPGLSDADQEKLFQRGVRLTPQPTSGEASTGYGLAVAKDLATALGARLTCSSVLGEGSCFMFSMPLHSSDVKTDDEPLQLHSPSTSEAA
jgi:signal transduction histidine kinase